MLSRAGDHQIFLVWRGDYRTLEGQCEALYNYLGASRPSATTLVSGSSNYYEPGSVTLFRPPS